MKTRAQGSPSSQQPPARVNTRENNIERNNQGDIKRKQTLWIHKILFTHA